MHVRILIAALLTIFAAGADARPRGAVSSGASGGTLLNVPVIGQSAPLFANFMQSSTNNGLDPLNWGLIADNGLPNGNTLAANYTVTPTIPAVSTSDVMVVDWVGTMPANALTAFAAVTATSCTSAAGGTNCATHCVSSGGSGTGNIVFGKAGANGQNCRVEFTFAAAQPGTLSRPVMFFNSGTAPNLTSLRFFRKVDETNNGGVLPTWNPDYIASLGASGTNTRISRVMGNVLSAGQENVLTSPSYALRTPIGSISYGSKTFPANAIGVGNLTLTGVNWAASASYPGQPADWVDKEVFQGNFQSAGVSMTVTSAANNGAGLVRLTVADTSTLTTGQVICYTGYNATGGVGYGLWTITVVSGTQLDLTSSYPAGNASVFATYSGNPGFLTAMTMQIGARTPKPLIGPGAFPMGANSINVIAAGIGTCMYDGQLDAVTCSPGGLYTGLSPELSVSLANQSNTDLWLNFSSNIDDASVASIAQMVSANLNPSLNVYLEYSNEPWNLAFYQSFLFSKKAEAVGATTTPTQLSTTGVFSWQGLRSAQIFRTFASNWSGTATRVKGAFNVQFAPGVTGGQVLTSGFNGGSLDPTSKSRLCSYLGGTFSGTCSGAVNYSASPNRPIDVTRIVSYAPYAGSRWSDGEYGRNTVSNATNNGSGLIRLTLNDAALLTTGLSMTVQGVRGTTEANGTWTLTKINSTTVDLQGSTFVNAYTGGGVMGNSNYPFNLAVTYQSSPATALSALSTLMVTGPVNGYSGNTAYGEWETALATYDAGRPSGYGPLQVVCYEGGQDIWAAQVADYTTAGLTTAATVTFNVGTSPAVNQTGHPYINGSKVRFSGGSGYTGIAASQDYFVINASANAYDVSTTFYNQTAVVVGGTPTGTITATGSTTSIDNLYEAWKNSTAATTWMVNYNANFKSYSHSQYMGILQVIGNNWDLSQGGSTTQNAANRWSTYQQYFTPSVAVPYKFINGLQQINFLLERDVNPASNDNTPMWLEQAA